MNRPRRFAVASPWALLLIVLHFAGLPREARTEELRVRQPLPAAADIAALPPDGGREFNRLVFETSPYLRQHARNPVDWRPWGAEALALAKAEGKPVFLSVGYSTCHWCHVMEHESFEHDEVAAILNEHYVCIKVDREERPDIDAIYMTATQLFAGRGGWPNSVWLTPEGKPWFAGTYYPRDDRDGRPGFKTLLTKLREVWDERPADVQAQADKIAEAIAQQGTLPAAAGSLDRALVEGALEQVAAQYDAELGGFGGAPKFPPHQTLALLLAEHRRGGSEDALAMVLRTLEAMAEGGIHDHLGGGFHRYSTDARWFLPHFEKMLYDNAQLLPIYAEAASITGRDDLADVARGIAGWALRDMRDPAGGFHSALDADSEGEEGRFYLWTSEQLAAVLGEAEAARFGDVYGLEPGGNYHEEATGHRPGTSILYLPRALRTGVDRAALAGQRERLREARDRSRVWPEKDDKVLTAWNGLMIAGLARAGALLDEPAWIDAAAEAADFLLARCRRDGRLLRSFREGRAALAAYLDDHAFLALGLLELHAATGDVAHLERARTLMDVLLKRYWDEDGAGFFFTAHDHEALLHRGKDPFDGALPSGNGVAAPVLLRLAAAGAPHANEHYGDRALELLSAFQPAIERAPRGCASLIAALALHLEETGEEGMPPVEGADGAADAFARRGPVAAELYLSSNTAVKGEELEALVRLGVDSAWHVNAHEPGSADLVPTRLELATGSVFELLDLRYPPGDEVRVPYAADATRVYSGDRWLKARLRATADEGPVEFALHFQPCDASRCLPPDSLTLRAEMGGKGGWRHARLFRSH